MALRLFQLLSLSVSVFSSPTFPVDGDGRPIIPVPTQWYTKLKKNSGLLFDDAEKVASILRELQIDIDTHLYGPNVRPSPYLINSLDELKFEGDIILSAKQAEEILTAVDKALLNKTPDFGVIYHRNNPRWGWVIPAPRKRSVVKEATKKWTMPIPYEFDHSDLNAQEIQEIVRAIAFWQDHTCVSFRHMEIGEHPPQFFIRFIKDNDHRLILRSYSCYSSVGRQNGLQLISIGQGCSTGLWHQQSRPDRDRYVRILNDNIMPNASRNFVLYDQSLVELYGIPYDHGSAMHYGSNYFAKNPGLTTVETLLPGYQKTIGNQEFPQFYDIKMINEHYCKDICPTNQCKNGGYPNVRNCAICNCPNGLTGPTCEGVDSNISKLCGGDIIAGPKLLEITSPGWGTDQKIKADTSCKWRITTTSPTSRAILKFNSNQFSFVCTDQCQNYVEVKNGTDFGLTGMRMCCNDPIEQFMSAGNVMLLIMRSQIGGDTGFKATFQEVCPKDIIFVFDTSISVELVAKRQKFVAIDTVNKIEKSQSRTALITYSESAKVVVSLANKDSSEILIAYLRNLGITGGSTDTVAALQAAYNEFNSIADRTPDTKKFLVLLTDGHSMNSLTNLTDISDQLKRTGVEMVVISAAADGGKDELEILASPKSYFLGENFETIIDRFSCAT